MKLKIISIEPNHKPTTTQPLPTPRINQNLLILHTLLPGPNISEDYQY